MNHSANFTLNAKQARADFERDGFFIAKALIPRTFPEACLQEISALFSDQLALLGLPDSGDLFQQARTLHDNDIARYKKVLASLWRLAAVGDIFHQPAIRQFLRDVLQFDRIFVPGGQVIHIQSEELKIPDGYFGFATHQDWPSIQGSMDGVVVWVPLCTIDANSYPLEVIPGTHRQGLLPSINPDENAVWALTEQPDSHYIPVVTEPGDVVFMSNFTLHRSGTKGKPDFMRIACSSRFDNGTERSFVQRAYPSAYTRSVQRKLMDFASVDEVNQAIERTKERPHGKN